MRLDSANRELILKAQFAAEQTQKDNACYRHRCSIIYDLCEFEWPINFYLCRKHVHEVGRQSSAHTLSYKRLVHNCPLSNFLFFRSLLIRWLEVHVSLLSSAISFPLWYLFDVLIAAGDLFLLKSFDNKLVLMIAQAESLKLLKSLEDTRFYI